MGLFVWFLFWFKNEPHGVNGQVLLWAASFDSLVRDSSGKATFWWIYLLPLGIFWILLIIALSGGISAPCNTSCGETVETRRLPRNSGDERNGECLADCLRGFRVAGHPPATVVILHDCPEAGTQ